MDMTWLFEFLYEHAGEIILGIEFFLVTVLGKCLNKKDKTLTNAQVEKLKAKKAKQAQKLVAKSQSIMSEIDELEKEE